MRMRVIGRVSLCCLGLAFLASAGCAPRARPLVLPEGAAPVVVEEPPARPAPQPLGPIVRGTDDLKPPAKPPEASPPPTAPALKVEVDPAARTLRIPVRVSLKPGVLEWLLSAGPKHAGMSVLVTDCPTREIAEAMAKIGLQSGVRPQPVGEDRVRPPQGQAVEVLLDMAVKEGPGPLAASSVFSMKSGGPPLGAGAWIYVGPQTFRESDTEINVTDLTGSLITTNLRDSSAMIYWVPAETDPVLPYTAAYYASKDAPPPGATGMLTIRAAAPRPPAPPEKPVPVDPAK